MLDLHQILQDKAEEEITRVMELRDLMSGGEVTKSLRKSKRRASKQILDGTLKFKKGMITLFLKIHGSSRD